MGDKMFKKIMAFSALFLFFAGASIAQEDVEEVTKDSPNEAVGTDAPADRAVTAETKTEGDAAEEVKTAPEQTAKTYFDGVTTYANSKVKFQLFTSDNFYADKIFYKTNDGQDTEYTAPFSLDAEGKYSVKYYGVDKVGNKEDEKIFRVVIDNTAPVVTIATKSPIVLVNNVYYTTSANRFTVTGYDALSGFYMALYSLNGTESTEYATTFSFNIAGDAELKIASEDNVANKTNKFSIKLPQADGTETLSEVESLKVFVDNVPPTVAITPDKPLMDKLGKKVASTEYKFAVTGEDKESGLKKILVRVDGKGEFALYEKEIQFVSNGDHFIEAKTVDAVGNESSIAILPVYIDIVPPKSELKAVTE